MSVKIILLFFIYVIGFICSYHYMYNFFKRDYLSDFAFKIHVLFLSSVWPLFWFIFCSVLIFPFIFIFPILYILENILDLFKNKKL